MARNGTTRFCEPNEFRKIFGKTPMELIVTGRGEFDARVTSVSLPDLQLFWSRERQARVAYLSLPQNRLFISFAMHFDPLPLYNGIKMRADDVVLHARGEHIHQRTTGPTQWALISLTHEYLAKFGRPILGGSFITPLGGRVFRPPANVISNLRHEFARACRAADSKRNFVEHREVARAIEQDVLHALVNCLVANNAHTYPATTKHQASIMRRLESALAAEPDQQLPIPELCSAICAAERTVRTCCAKFLGIGPSHYIKLRRLTMARADLLRTDIAEQRIARVAAHHGFSEAGRFAVEYRSAFGETPSETRRRASRTLCASTTAEFA